MPGPTGAEDEALAPVLEALRRLARQFAGLFVDLVRLVGDVELAERDRRRAEGVRLHHVGAGLVIAAMDFADEVGPGQDQHVGAVFHAPVIALHIQVEHLNSASHAAVA